MRAGYLALFSLVLSSLPGPSAWAAPPKWQGEIPQHVKDPALWNDLLGELMDRQMYHGAMAAAARMLVFFSGIDTKTTAYKAVIELVNVGYPFSTLPIFLTGDLSPSGEYDFVNNYNLYKFILNKEHGLDKWSKHYLEGIDQEKFPKFQLYSAMDAYSQGDLKTAGEKLEKLLSGDLDAAHYSLARKASRTLARVYFDQKEYEKAFEIYSTFLLKLKPVVPADWLEAAWCLYYLKRYPEAIGYLYNLESHAADDFINLEKYTIRALSYRNLCQTGHAETLIESFKSDYGSIVSALKRGEKVSNFPQLAELDVPGNETYRQLSLTLNYLRLETTNLPAMSKKLKSLANYLYQTEINMLSQKRKAYTDTALERAATKLLMTEEHLKFLSFDVQRERFNPDKVFMIHKDEEEQGSSVEDLADSQFRIHWVQLGDFWRDERLNYIGMVSDACPD